ncbi:unnamed protein product, partial [Prorocentrum cordatum]
MFVEFAMPRLPSLLETASGPCMTNLALIEFVNDSQWAMATQCEATSGPSLTRAETLTHEWGVTEECGYQRLTGLSLRLRKGGFAWFELGEDAWMPWGQVDFERSANLPLGNTKSPKVVKENLRIQRLATIGTIVWLRGGHQAWAYRPVSYAQKNHYYVALSKLALKHEISVSIPVTKNGQLRMDIFSSTIHIKSLSGDTPSSTIYSVYKSTDNFVADVANAVKLAFED